MITRFVRGEYRMDLPGARAVYLEHFGKAIERSDAHAIAFNLMSTHVHHAIIVGEEPLSNIFRGVHTAFSKFVNERENRFGAVFASRFKSITIDRALAIVLIAYMHNNDVRAGVVPSARLSRWSTHRAYLGLEAPPSWLDVELGLQLCGFDESVESRAAFGAWVESAAHGCRRPELSAESAVFARRELLRDLSGAHELSTPRLAANGSTTWQVIRPRAVPRIAGWRGTADVAIAIAADLSELDHASLRSRSRVRVVAHTRAALLLAWTHGLGRRQIDIARALGLSESTASNLLHRTGANPSVAALAARIVGACEHATGPLSVPARRRVASF